MLVLVAQVIAFRVLKESLLVRSPATAKIVLNLHMNQMLIVLNVKIVMKALQHFLKDQYQRPIVLIH